MLRVSVSYHELYGLSLVVSDIDPAYTLGDIEQERQRTILRLQSDGVFGLNRELPLTLIQRIAVVSSRNAAGYQDFMREIDRSEYRFETILFDAFMQGDGAEDSIVAALESIAENYENFDAVVMIRGGGSQSDLSCFNSYRLCAHIAQFPLPVITGIGHDKDRSVADMVAAVELKTPTAVATFLVERMDDEYACLESMQGGIARFASAFIDTCKRNLLINSVGLQHVSAEMTRRVERRLDDLGSRIVFKHKELVSGKRIRLDILAAILAERSVRAVNDRRAVLDIMKSRVEGRDPRRILAMGFAVVRSGGKTIKSSATVQQGQQLDISLAEGRIIANVEKTE